jgi:hypothetical protein
VPEGESGLHMDPVTKDTFTNASRLVVLVPSGEVVLKETYRSCIQDEGNFNGGCVGWVGVWVWGCGWVSGCGRGEGLGELLASPGAAAQLLRLQRPGPQLALHLGAPTLGTRQPSARAWPARPPQRPTPPRAAASLPPARRLQSQGRDRAADRRHGLCGPRRRQGPPRLPEACPSCQRPACLPARRQCSCAGGCGRAACVLTAAPALPRRRWRPRSGSTWAWATGWRTCAGSWAAPWAARWAA